MVVSIDEDKPDEPLVHLGWVMSRGKTQIIGVDDHRDRSIPTHIESAWLKYMHWIKSNLLLPIWCRFNNR